MCRMNHQYHHTASGQDLYTTSMEFTQDYRLCPLQAPISPKETHQILQRRPSVPYQEPRQAHHPISPFDSSHDRQIPHHTDHHHLPVILQSNSNAYI